MTDDELLELAAKAVGGMEFTDHWHPKNKPYIDWEPLIDDGDALRLAVKLGLDLEVFYDGIRACYDEADRGEHSFYIEEFEFFGSNKYAATRRAIVRAAAEIGKTL